MNNSATLPLFACAFGILMILLWPFVSYQATFATNFSDNNPNTSLLQRLVKKKELHAEDTLEASEILNTTAIRLILPMLLLFFSHRIFSPSMLVSGTKGRNTVFQISPFNDYYLLLLKLLI